EGSAWKLSPSLRLVRGRNAPSRAVLAVQGSTASRHEVGMSPVLATVAVGERRTPRCVGAAYSRSCVTSTSESPQEDAALLRLRLLACARRSLANDVAEDLVQETILLLTTKYADVRATEDRVRLGITILVKKRSAHWRKSRRRGETDAVDAADAALEDGQPD